MSGFIAANRTPELRRRLLGLIWMLTFGGMQWRIAGFLSGIPFTTLRCCPGWPSWGSRAICWAIIHAHHQRGRNDKITPSVNFMSRHAGGFPH